MGDMLRMPVFHGDGSEDPEQQLFVCKAIWATKQVQDEASQIAQLTTTFRDDAFKWCMKYQRTALVGPPL